MWPSWRRSSPRVHNSTASSSSSSSSIFRCSSFKDLQTLCDDDTTSTTSTSGGNHHLLLLHQQHLQRPVSAKKIFHRVRVASSLLRNWQTTTTTTSTSTFTTKPNSQSKPPQPYQDQYESKSHPQSPPREISIHGAENRIVLYTTSLRVIRQTFTACRDVKQILTSFRVPIDERDLSMDTTFLDELRSIIKSDCNNNNDDGDNKPPPPLRLPRVFIAGRYVGGAEEVRQMHEVGDLKKLIEGLTTATATTTMMMDPRVCGACGGYRFVLCGACDGSHKVYYEKMEVFRSCEMCNRNGLARCLSCNPTALVLR